MMTYKGYTGVAEIDAEAGVIHGRVIGLRDVVTFEGKTAAETMRAFRESVDDYLDFCAKLGQSPEKPLSGRFNLRLGTDLHRALAVRAETQRISLNEAACRAIAKDLGMAPGTETGTTTANVSPKSRAASMPKPAAPGRRKSSTVAEGKGSAR